MKISIDKTLQQYLEEFDLNEREIMIYITLLKTGPNTIMNLARETGIKRSTTHNNVEELIKKGLVSQTNYGERRMVVAEDPEKLKFLLEQKKWNVKKVEENLPTVISLINKMVPDARENSQVQVKYYEGTEGTNYVYQRILEANKIYSFVNLGELSEIFPNNIKLFREALEKNPEMEVWDIIEDEKGSKEDTSINTIHPDRYHFKYASSNLNLFELDIIIFDGNVAIIDLHEESPTSVLMEFPTLAKGLVSIHKFVWNLLQN